MAFVSANITNVDLRRNASGVLIAILATAEMVDDRIAGPWRATFRFAGADLEALPAGASALRSAIRNIVMQYLRACYPIWINNFLTNSTPATSQTDDPALIAAYTSAEIVS